MLVLAAVLIVAPARSADSPTPPSVESLPETWGAPGTPGFVPDLHLCTGLPFHYLGLLSGGVALRDDLLPETGPWPGIEEIAAPLAWYDSTKVVIGEGGGWRGFSASLVELRAIARPPVGGRPRAAFTLVNGSSAVDRTGLLIARGGGDSWGRGGVLTEQRSGVGLLGQHGQHVWFAELGRRRGAHTFSGVFAQRGLSGSTRSDSRFLGPDAPPFVGFEEAARGEAGGLSWAWQGPSRSLVTRWSRSHDQRESFESELFSFAAERQGQNEVLTVEASAGSGERTHGLRVELGRAQVRRTQELLNGIFQPPTSATQRTGWLAVRDQRPFAGGSLELELGGGHTSAPGDADERWQLAPSAVWRLGPEARRLRLFAERLVTPVWSDLAPGIRPFVQDAWLAGADVTAGIASRQWLNLGVLGAEIGNRANLVRFPVRDVSLRYGWSQEGVRVQDAMATVAAGVRRGAWALEASGFSRIRPAGAQPVKVDPAVGARAAAETGFRAFAGDLGVRVRLEAAWVGERENESLPAYFTPPRPLAGYATYAGSAAFTVGDATVVVRAANLEDQPHLQTWTDPSSPFPGVPAVGSARQFRVELSWPFFN